MKIIVSLFDGMSCAQQAIDRLGIKNYTYYASEIDKYAIKVTQTNYPNTKQLGDITKIKGSDIGWVDLLIGGSPCQGFSIAGKQLNFNDPRSALFFEYVRILKELKEINPKIEFVLENVRMKKEYQDVISSQLGVEPVMINSALVSAQNRVRLYWANFGITQPMDKGILLKDILETGVTDRDKSYCIDANYYKGGSLNRYFEKSSRQLVQAAIKQINPDKTAGGKQPRMQDRIYDESGKSAALTSFASRTLVGTKQSERRLLQVKEKSNTNRVGGHSSPPESKQCWDNALQSKIYYRKLSVIECERLQTVRDGYTSSVSNSQAYKMLGNGMTIDIIVHILSLSDLFKQPNLGSYEPEVSI